MQQPNFFKLPPKLDFNQLLKPSAIVPLSGLKNMGKGLTTKVKNPFPDEVEKRLREYAEVFRLSPGRILARYQEHPLHYSLDRIIIICSDPIKAICLMTGQNAIPTSKVSLYGYHHYHSGLIDKNDSKNGTSIKRKTVYTFDLSVIKALKHDEALKFTDIFVRFADQVNHDPFHTIGNNSKLFEAYDKHFRYGGVELVPIILQAALIREQIKRDTSKKDSIKKDLLDYIDIVKTVSCENPEIKTRMQMYLISILLRRAVLIFSYDDPIISEFLTKAQSQIFDNKQVVIKPDSYVKFLETHFSHGGHKDPLPENHPAHVNRSKSVPYEHGKNSFITPWIRSFFAGYFGEDYTKETTQGVGTLLLLDVMKGGYGIFCAVSAYNATKPIKIEELIKTIK